MQSIVPQLRKSFGWPLHRVFALVLSAGAVLLSACSTPVQLQANKPVAPATLDEAKRYVDNREKSLEFLEYEMNEQARECYTRFFVASCLDDLRVQGAQIRRAHQEVQGKAEDMIRLDDYARKRTTDNKPLP